MTSWRMGSPDQQKDNYKTKTKTKSIDNDNDKSKANSKEIKTSKPTWRRGSPTPASFRSSCSCRQKSSLTDSSQPKQKTWLTSQNNILVIHAFLIQMANLSNMWRRPRPAGFEVVVEMFCQCWQPLLTQLFAKLNSLPIHCHFSLACLSELFLKMNEWLVPHSQGIYKWMNGQDESHELIIVPYSQAPICDLNTRPALLWR